MDASYRETTIQALEGMLEMIKAQDRHIDRLQEVIEDQRAAMMTEKFEQAFNYADNQTPPPQDQEGCP